MSLNEWGIIGATIGVIVGVVLEGWEHWNNFRRKGWRPCIPKIGFGILVVSLAIEIVFDARLAKESAETRLQAATIEEAIAWRALSAGQKTALASALSTFSGELGSLWYNSPDVEASFFAADIASALRQAHWRVSPPASVIKLMEGGVIGAPTKALETGVTVVSTGDDASLKAANALVANLVKYGFDATKTREPDKNPNPQVWINVEPRPRGPQGKAKLRQGKE